MNEDHLVGKLSFNRSVKLVSKLNQVGPAPTIELRLASAKLQMAWVLSLECCKHTFEQQAGCVSLPASAVHPLKNAILQSFRGPFTAALMLWEPYALGTLCSWNTNEIMIWAWMFWEPYALGARTEL